MKMQSATQFEGNAGVIAQATTPEITAGDVSSKSQKTGSCLNRSAGQLVESRIFEMRSSFIRVWLLREPLGGMRK
jgi:hypothetical protein